VTVTELPVGTTEEVMKRLFPEPDPYADQPVEWVHDRLDEETWSKQVEILESVRDNRYTAVQSCHDSGKSYSASRLMSWWIDAHPPGTAFVVSTAPSQHQVETILWNEVGRAHRKGDLVGRITYGMVPRWKLGPEIVGFGRKPADLASKEEAMSTFQGIHNEFVLVVIDEAGGVPKWLYDAVDTLVTNEKARVLAIGNPDDPTSHFAKVCAPGSGWNVIRISYQDTPNFSGEPVSDNLRDLLLSRLWVQERAQRWGETSPLYVSKVLGEFPDVSDDTLLPPKLLRACQELSLPGTTKGRFGADVARFGEDQTSVYRNRGGVIRRAFVGGKMDTVEVTGHFARLLNERNGHVPMVIDSIGLGAGPYDNLNNDGQPVEEFVASEKAFDPDRFVNRRAEAWWGFREACENGEIDLPPEKEDDELIAQLGSLKWGIDKRGRIKIESKEEAKKRGLPSPDLADAAMMSAQKGPEIHVPTESEIGPSRSITGDLMKREL
jgi:hypothetical protein